MGSLDLTVQVAHRSELGYVRTRNEDASFVQPLGDGAYLLGVADGMGGHPAGDVASKVAVATILGAAATLADVPEGGEHWLTDVLLTAHEAVLSTAAAEPAYEGMGTTAVIAIVQPDRAQLAHVGDSRAYLIRAGSAQQLTQDHNRHGYLTQALGVPRPIVADSQTVALQPGDRLLICTDGLSGLVSNAGIAAQADTHDAADSVDRLVDAALAAGGYDNVTAVLIAV
jgi:serine/threonine protein phosphatase PrpC